MGHWDEHPDHPVADWKSEVANDDTRLGYQEWCWQKFDEPSSKRVRIYKDVQASPEFPWFYSVEHDPPREDALDYGSVESWERACRCVQHVLDHPENYV